jgi:hypothetical protein
VAALAARSPRGDRRAWLCRECLFRCAGRVGAGRGRRGTGWDRPVAEQPPGVGGGDQPGVGGRAHVVAQHGGGGVKQRARDPAGHQHQQPDDEGRHRPAGNHQAGQDRRRDQEEQPEQHRQAVEAAGRQLHQDGIVLGREPERRIPVGEQPGVGVDPGGVPGEVAQVAGQRLGQPPQHQRGEPPQHDDDNAYQQQQVQDDDLGQDQQQPERDAQPPTALDTLDDERWRDGRVVDGTHGYQSSSIRTSRTHLR